MKDLKDFINEAEDKVYSIQDETGTILNIFPSKKDADDDLKNWPKDAKPKVVPINKKDIEN